MQTSVKHDRLLYCHPASRFSPLSKIFACTFFLIDHSQLHSCPPPHHSELFCLVPSRKTLAKQKKRPNLVDISEKQEHPIFLLDNTSEEPDIDLLLDNKRSDQVAEKLVTEMMMVKLALVWRRQRE